MSTTLQPENPRTPFDALCFLASQHGWRKDETINIAEIEKLRQEPATTKEVGHLKALNEKVLLQIAQPANPEEETPRHKHGLLEQIAQWWAAMNPQQAAGLLRKPDDTPISSDLSSEIDSIIGKSLKDGKDDGDEPHDRK